MCSDGTCYACRQRVAHANAQEETFAKRWRSKKAPVVRGHGSATGGDPLDTSSLNMALIAEMIRQQNEGGGKNKEEK